ncbi:hypothetical protein [Deinococcus pimensis]|uniref:hypothetical protein n=1 Tax=Deinococcus pimensis TaxID=309888 RepID=UPI00047FB6A9|nr:hypothetical protein [Deinococcus pimensis]
MSAVTLRELSLPRDGFEVEELQLAVWGRSEREVVARDVLTALQLQGALLAGAFEARPGNAGRAVEVEARPGEAGRAVEVEARPGNAGRAVEVAEGKMIGFVFGFPTARADVQHSHMLAVLPAWRRSSVALDLKRFQRDWCLARGVTRVEWTFDPLRGLNANFNLRKLGATVEGYFEHLYGDMSGINAGVASDRALASWDLASARVEGALRGELPVDLAGAVTVNPDAPLTGALPDAPRVRVLIPEDFGALLTGDHALAVRWRAHGREVLGHYLRGGYVATGFSREGGNAYVLERP